MCKDCGCASTGSVKSVVLKVPGMMCGNCEEAVNTALLALPGVMESKVDLDVKEVMVRFDGAKATVEALRAAIEGTGFDVESVVEDTCGCGCGHSHSHEGGILGTIKRLLK